MSKRVVLAYSGGLDTSIIVPWLREERGAEVICMAADVGQREELAGLEARARAQGASDFVMEDVREELVSEAILPMLRAGAVYGRKYLLGTAIARPLIARRQVEVARRYGARAVAHGCTGKGNDQVRFELTYAAFGPDLEVIAPWRTWGIESREQALEYAAARGIAVPVSREKIYSRDCNLWHVSHEGGLLENPAFEPPPDLYLLTRSPEAAPDSPAYVQIEFESGVPTAVDGQTLPALALLERLNELGAEHGIGREDIIEDRVVGMKSRGVYETPGGTLLYAAHRELEQLVLDRRTLELKDGLANRYASLVYEGRWWSMEREALDALIDRTQAPVTGWVRLKLFKGSLAVVGRSSPESLYDSELATFGAGADFDHADASGFIRLLSLPERAEAARRGEPPARPAARFRDVSGPGADWTDSPQPAPQAAVEV